MRKRRTDAKTRVAIRAYLAGEVGVVETCQFLSPRLSWDADLLGKDDILFINEVADHLSGTLLRTEWNSEFAAPKLKQLELYEASVRSQVQEVCLKILATMEQRKHDVECDADS